MADLPELKMFDLSQTLGNAQMNALRGMQMQKISDELEQQNALRKIMQGATNGEAIDYDKAARSLIATGRPQLMEMGRKLLNEQARSKQFDEFFPAAGGQPYAADVRQMFPGVGNIPQTRLTPEAIGRFLKTPGSEPDAKILLDIWKAQNPELTNVPGVGMVNPRTANVVADMPRITDTGRAAGLKRDSTGNWSAYVPPGSVDAYKGFQVADEQAKASNSLETFKLGGRDITLPRDLAISVLRGNAPTEQSAQDAAVAADRQGVPISIKGPAQNPTAGELETDKRLAEQDVIRVTDFEKKIPQLALTMRRIDRMKFLTQDDRTYAAAGAELKKTLGSIAQGFGLKINPNETANTEQYIANVAELLKDRLASKDYGSGTGISNLDLIAAEKPLPELAKTAQGRIQILDALRKDTELSLQDATAARAHFGKNKNLRGFTYPSESVQFSQPGEQKSPAAPAQQAKGKANSGEVVFKDASGNKAVKRNGQWVEVE